MKNNKDEWKIETVGSLRRYKIRVKGLKVLEIIYHTIIPMLLTYWMVYYHNPSLIIPLIIIIFLRLNVK